MSAEDDNIRLTEYLQEAEATNLALREENFNLKRQLQAAQANNQNSYYASQVETMRESERNMQSELISHKSEVTRLREENLHLRSQADESERVRMDNLRLEQSLQETKNRLQSAVESTERLRFELEQGRIHNDETHNERAHQENYGNLEVKTRYNGENRIWIPTTSTPYKELFDHIKEQNDAFHITWKGLNGDTIHVPNESELRHAFSAALNHRNGQLTLEVQSALENRLHNENVRLTMKYQQLKKKLEKAKRARHQKKYMPGQILLDEILVNSGKDGLYRKYLTQKDKF